MVRTVINGIEVQAWIVDSGYKINIAPVYGSHSFTDVNGNEVQNRLGDKITLSLNLEGVPHPVAMQLAEAVQDESFDVEYTTPAPAVSKFKKTSYAAVCSDSDPDETDCTVTEDIEWDIDITLESVGCSSADSGSRL
ncbi:MAG: hypothetical protein IJF18_02045 [Oscillospiraceae bacterium]|nr:hypothetical protein [Oscillospiraceae bacterium]